jgi:cell division transport system permease protein
MAIPARIFRADASSRYQPWIMGLAAFLATLSLAAVIAIDHTLDRWEEATPGIVTVQLQPGKDRSADERRALTIQNKLRALPDVAAADLLPPQQVTALLTPWLGENAEAEELPLPRVLHIRLRSSAPDATENIRAAVTAEAPDALVDDHRIWRTRLVNYVSWLRGGMAAQLVLVLTVAGLTAVFLTLARMTIHREAVELLHQLGAEDRYIAASVVRRSALSASVSTILGFALGASFLFATGEAAAEMDDIFMPVLRLQRIDWLWLVGVPIGIVALTVIVASVTAKRHLRRLL